jgi:hypothetical protein
LRLATGISTNKSVVVYAAVLTIQIANFFFFSFFLCPFHFRDVVIVGSSSSETNPDYDSFEDRLRQYRAGLEETPLRQAPSVGTQYLNLTSRPCASSFFIYFIWRVWLLYSGERVLKQFVHSIRR